MDCDGYDDEHHFGNCQNGHVEFTVGQNLLWFYAGTGMYVENVDFATVESPWRQVVLDELRPFTVIRMMDAGMTNLNYTSSWAERGQKTDPDQYRRGSMLPVIRAWRTNG